MSAAWLDPALTSVALCWRLDRRDGVSLGFTSHDRDLLIEGLTYRAAPGMTPSAVSQSDAFDVDTLDIAGALTSDAIADADLLAGRWDGAAVRLFAADWSDPAAATVPLARGTLGDVSQRDGAFTAEMRGPTAVLERPVVEQTSPDCRASLGDKRCRVDLAPRTHLVRLAAPAAGMAVLLDIAEPSAGVFAYPLRSADARAAEVAFRAAGLRAVAVGEAQAGDLVLLAAAATQLHLAVLTDIGFVHADAGLRRIVETPGRPPAILSVWREED